MGLIKSQDVPISVSVFSLQDIEAAAKRILLRARAEADQIIATTKAETDQTRELASREGFVKGQNLGHAEGFEAGKKAGHAQALAENSAAMKQLIESLTKSVKLLDDERDLMQNNALIEVIRLACAIARKVTKRQGMLDEQVLCDNVKEALSLAVHAADVRIAVNPKQLKTLQTELPNLQLKWPQLKHIELTEDAAIAPGGARVATVHGNIDAQLDSQLDHVISELLPSAEGA
jgi:flagellar assembly protein FliH